MIHIDPTTPWPHSPGHEKDVIAAIVNYPERFDEHPNLTPAHFHLPDMRTMFELIVEMRETHGTHYGGFDFTTMFEIANQRGLLNRMGGAGTVIGMMNRPTPPEATPVHVEKLNQYLARRMALDAALALAKAAVESEDPQEMLEAASAPMTAIHEAVSAARPPMTQAQVLDASFTGYMERLKGIQTPMGIPTIWEIDQLIRGLHPGRVIVIGAYPGGGKSVISSQIITDIAISGVPVLEVNYEMKEHDSMDRKIIQHSRVPSMAFMDPIGYAKENDCEPIDKGVMQKIKLTAAELKNCPMRIVKPANTQLRTLIATIRKAHREMGAKVVAIDYLQKVRAKSTSREDEITQVSNAIFDVAGELGLSVLLLSQLNADGDTKHGVVAIEDCDAYIIINQERDKKADNYGQHYDCTLVKDRFCGNGGRSIPLIFDSNRVAFVHGFVPRGTGKAATPKRKEFAR